MPEPIRDAASATTYHGFSAVPAGGAARSVRSRRSSQAGLAIGAAALAGLLAWFVAGDDDVVLHRPSAAQPTAASATATKVPAESGVAAIPAAPQILPVEAPAPAAKPRAAHRSGAPRASTHAVRPQPIARVAMRPEFHCDWRLRRSERMICGDARLSQLDRELNHAYGQAVLSGVSRARLRRAQDAWVMRREAHARSPQTLAAYYRQRIAALDTLARRRRGHG